MKSNMANDRGWLWFEWSDNLDAWVITVDKDARLTISEIEKVVKNDQFVVRVSPAAEN